MVAEEGGGDSVVDPGGDISDRVVMVLEMLYQLDLVAFLTSTFDLCQFKIDGVVAVGSLGLVLVADGGALAFGIVGNPGDAGSRGGSLAASDYPEAFERVGAVVGGMLGIAVIIGASESAANGVDPGTGGIYFLFQ